MKYKFIRLLIAFFALSAVIFHKPLIVFIARRQLQNTFKASAVSIGGCVFQPAKLLVFTDIQIDHLPKYEIKIREVKFNYRPLSLLQLIIGQIEIKEATVKVSIGKSNAVDIIKGYLKETAARKGILRIENLRIADLGINLKSADLIFSAKATLNIDPLKQIINSGRISVASLSYRGASFCNGELTVEQGSDDGKLEVSEAGYNKLKIRQIKSSAGLKGKDLIFPTLSGRLLCGDFSGNVSLILDEGIRYFAKLNFSALDLGCYVKDFELEEKFSMAGKLSGSLAMEGKDGAFRVVNGALSVSQEGGTLVIKDNRFLENLAQRSEKSLNILVEGFKDYHYNIGVIKLFLEKENLVFNIGLEGEKGRRNIEVVLHGFKTKKEGL